VKNNVEVYVPTSGDLLPGHRVIIWDHGIGGKLEFLVCCPV